MLAGRFLMMIPMLAIAGNLAGKNYFPESLGTFPVTTPPFTVLLISVILIVGALTFSPCSVWARFLSTCLWSLARLSRIYGNQKFPFKGSR